MLWRSVWRCWEKNWKRSCRTKLWCRRFFRKVFRHKFRCCDRFTHHLTGCNWSACVSHCVADKNILWIGLLSKAMSIRVWVLAVKGVTPCHEGCNKMCRKQQFGCGYSAVKILSSVFLVQVKTTSSPLVVLFTGNRWRLGHVKLPDKS